MRGSVQVALETSILAKSKHHGRPSLLSFLPRPTVLTFLPQTPVVLQDEDIFSDVVPSNIVSRQVYSCTNARGFQGLRLYPFFIGYSRRGG